MASSAQLSAQQPITFQPAEKTFSSLHVGGGLPPVQAKLVRCIQDGQFIKRVELFSEVLRGPMATPYDDDQQKSSKSKYWELNGIRS